MLRVDENVFGIISNYFFLTGDALHYNTLQQIQILTRLIIPSNVSVINTLVNLFMIALNTNLNPHASLLHSFMHNCILFKIIFKLRFIKTKATFNDDYWFVGKENNRILCKLNLSRRS